PAAFRVSRVAVDQETGTAKGGDEEKLSAFTVIFPVSVPGAPTVVSVTFVPAFNESETTFTLTKAPFPVGVTADSEPLMGVIVMLSWAPPPTVRLPGSSSHTPGVPPGAAALTEAEGSTTS